MDKFGHAYVHWKHIVTVNRDLHRNIAQQEEVDPRSRTLAAEGGHSDRSHTVELVGHTRIQVAGVDRDFAADTVRRLVEVGNLAATGAAAVARTWAPVGNLRGKLAVRTDSAAEIVGPVGGSDRIQGEVKAGVMDVVMGD